MRRPYASSNMDAKQSDKSKIKILRVITRLNIGGPAKQIETLTHVLEEESFDQLIVYGKCDEGEMQISLSVFSEKSEFFFLNTLGRRINFVKDIKTIFLLIRIVREYKPDIVHTHLSKAGALGRIAVFLSMHQCKLVHSFHGHVLGGYFSNVANMIFVFIEKILARNTDVLIAMGESLKKQLLGMSIGVSKQYAVSFPAVMTPARSDLQSKRSLNNTAGKVQILWVGRAVHIKRLDRLIEVAEILKIQCFENFYITVIGDGPELVKMKELSTLKSLPISFVGFQTAVDLFLQNSDIFLMTSDSEGTPVSIIEAQLAGIPVVATDVGSIRELIVHGKTGFLTSGDAEEISNYLSRLIHEPNLRLAMGADAIKYANSQFSIDVFQRFYRKLYLTLAERD